MSEKVYVAYYGYNYEGSTLVGVFETEQAAEARLGRLKPYYGDYTKVKEVEIGEDIEVNL